MIGCTVAIRTLVSLQWKVYVGLSWGQFIMGLECQAEEFVFPWKPVGNPLEGLAEPSVGRP